MRFVVLVMGLGLLSLNLMAPQKTYAADHVLKGSLALETPVGQTPDRAVDDSPSVLLNLSMDRVVGPVGVFFAGKLQTNKGLPWDTENRALVGLNMPIGSGLEAYTYFERRFDELGANRVMIGLRYGFTVKL